MVDGLPVAKSGDKVVTLLPGLANRHGLVTGATGTGKTVSLQTIAEQLSRIGVPVFMADVKGDLAGIAAAGGANAKVAARAQQLGVQLAYGACPAVFWDVFGKSGHPLRATVSHVGHSTTQTVTPSPVRTSSSPTWCENSRLSPANERLPTTMVP